MGSIIARTMGAIIVFILLIFALAFVTGNLNLLMTKYFGVKQQNIETQIFKETEMYNEAKQQELAKSKYEYETADSTGQKALRSLIRHRFADYDVDRLPEGLAEFLTEIRGY